MKKRLECLLNIFIVLLAFLGAFAVWGNELRHLISRSYYFFSPQSTNKVLSYETDIEKELKKHDIVSLTPILMTIMYQESRGEGKDPMQASESAGLKRNEIRDPHFSIQQGVYHFYQMYTIGKKYNVDMDTIIQSYNMGPGYIYYVAKNGFKHNENLAKEYSKIQVIRNPKLYTCGQFKGNFRYPYCFGDYTYATKVKEEIPTMVKRLKGS